MKYWEKNIKGVKVGINNQKIPDNLCKNSKKSDKMQ